MTAVRVRAALDDARLTQVLETLRAEPDVTEIVTTADGFEVGLAGYALDAAEARTAGLLRTVEASVGIERRALRTDHDPDATPGGFN